MLSIKDLPESAELDSQAMADISGGYALSDLGAFANVNVSIDQEINDIIIADISMPVINGLEATRKLSQSHPHINVLILTMHDNKEYMQNAIDSGAKGYILKDQPAAEMIAAVRSIYNGKKHFCSSATAVANSKKDANKLTKREQLILVELLDGLNNKSIAEKHSISVRTVECHRGNIYRKIESHSISGLIRYAKKHGYV